MSIAVLALAAALSTALPQTTANLASWLHSVPLPTVEAPPLNGQYDRDLDAATWVYVATAAADWTITPVCYAQGCGVHKAGLFLYDVKQAAAIPLGLAIDAGIVWVVREHLAPDHPKLARSLLYALSAVRVVFVATKVHDLTRDR